MSFNKKALKDKASQMIGKEFIYNAQGIKILNIRFDDAREKMVIETDLRNINKTYADGMDFLDEFQPMAAIAAVAKNPQHELEVQILAGYVRDDEFSSKMMTLLDETITKVKNDPKYVGQAKVIVNAVNSVMNIAKVKLMIREKTRKAS